MTECLWRRRAETLRPLIFWPAPPLAADGAMVARTLSYEGAEFELVDCNLSPLLRIQARPL